MLVSLHAKLSREVLRDLRTHSDAIAHSLISQTVAHFEQDVLQKSQLFHRFHHKKRVLPYLQYLDDENRFCQLAQRLSEHHGLQPVDFLRFMDELVFIEATICADRPTQE